MLFKDSLSNAKKLIQMGSSAYEYGFHSQHQLSSLRGDIFDQKMLDKLLVFYSPDRTSSKSIES